MSKYSSRPGGLIGLLLAFSSAFVFAMGAGAQPPASAGGPADPAAILRAATGTNSLPLDQFKKGILRVADNEDAFKALTTPLVQTILQTDQTNGLLGFINDLHLRPKIFHSENGSSDGVLGLEYNYQKSLANREFDVGSNKPVGISLTLQASGNVAVDAKKNPNNLLETGAGLHFFQGIGGINPSFVNSQEAAAALQRGIMEGIKDPAFAREQGPAYEQFAKEVTSHFAPQLFYDIQGHATLESDQQFNKKQMAYGGKFSVAFRDWRETSPVAWFNILDYPFAAVRWLLNKEDFQPSGRTFPSAVLGIDLVKPSAGVDPNKDSFPRFRAELAFKTRVFQWQNQRLYFSAAYRHFQELGASAAVKAGGLDHSDYFVAKLDLPYRFNVSYSIGKLPLDRKNDQVYALGWVLNF
jgi:hypothetical protein